MKGDIIEGSWSPQQHCLRKAYSIDLRNRIVKTSEAKGISQRNKREAVLLRSDRVLRRLTPSNDRRIKRDRAFTGAEGFQYRWKNAEEKENRRNFPADLINKVQYSIDREIVTLLFLA